jgi:cobalt-precorrin 5A hydrolase
MIVAGIGCGSNPAATEIVALIHAALESFGIATLDLAAIATEASKADELGLEAASLTLAVPLLRCSIAELDAVEEKLLTRSQRVLALKGTTSIAEAAALVGAGGNARLLGARIAAGRITCAIAEGEGA